MEMEEKDVLMFLKWREKWKGTISGNPWACRDSKDLQSPPTPDW